MKAKLIAPVIALALGACATVIDEQRQTRVLERGFYSGERYELRTRTMQGPNGTFVQTSVVYRGLSRTCIIDSPRDCELAAQRLIESYDDLFF